MPDGGPRWRWVPASCSMGAGQIVPKSHVVADASEVTVTLQDGAEYQGKVIGKDQ